MKNPDIPLRPPMLLAIAYAPAPIRRRLAWLLILDQRLLSILERTTEPMIAQLRLSWWRDALKLAPGKRPKGEPLLAELNQIEPDNALIDAGLLLVDAFEILATGGDSAEQDTARNQRISAICDAFAIWVGCAESQQKQIDYIADWWGDAAMPMPKSIPRVLRPLSILALAEQMESSDSTTAPVIHGLRLNWHALTGR